MMFPHRGASDQEGQSPQHCSHTLNAFALYELSKTRGISGDTTGRSAGDQGLHGVWFRLQKMPKVGRSRDTGSRITTAWSSEDEAVSCGLRCLSVHGWEFSYVGRWACHDSYTALGLYQEQLTCVLKMGKSHCTWTASQEGCCYYLACQKCPGQPQSRGKQDPGNHQIWPSG